MTDQTSLKHCLFTTFSSPGDLLHSNVERLWKTVAYSCKDHDAMTLLETKMERLEVEDVHRYATPLLRQVGGPKLNSLYTFSHGTCDGHREVPQIEEQRESSDLVS